MPNIQKRLSEDGNVSYRVRVRLKGYPLQSATFTRLTDAKKWAQNTESAIHEGRHFKTSEAKRHTLSELIERYLRDIMPLKPKSKKDQTQQLKWWQKEIGTYVLADVTPALLSEYRDKLLRQETPNGTPRAPSTVNRYIASLSHAFSIAMREWGWIEDNPFRKVSKLREPRGRIRFLSDEERTRLLEACQSSNSSYLYLIVVLALSTGARKNEILNLNWDNVDFNRMTIVLHETKNGERRLLPLTGHALALMKEHSQVRYLNNNFVFPGQRSKGSLDIRSAWEMALKKAEIENFRFHDLRHSTASYLAMNGASLAEIADVLGHKTLQMVKRYAHLSEAHTAKVVTRMNAKIFG